MAIIDACPNINHGTMLARPSCVPQATLPGDIRSLRMRSVLRAWGPQNWSCAHFSPQFGSPRLVTTALPGPEESCMSLVLLRLHTGGNYCAIQTDSAHHVLNSLGGGRGGVHPFCLVVCTMSGEFRMQHVLANSRQAQFHRTPTCIHYVLSVKKLTSGCWQRHIAHAAAVASMHDTLHRHLMALAPCRSPQHP